MQKFLSKLPPLLVWAICMLIAIGMNPYIRHIPLSKSHYLLGSFCILVALIILFLAQMRFSKQKTTVNPIEPLAASSLVVLGIYRYSRNPMYVAFTLLLIACAFFLNNGVAFIWAVFFWAYMNYLQIPKEEAALTQIFKLNYQQYCQQTRRWL